MHSSSKNCAPLAALAFALALLGPGDLDAGPAPYGEEFYRRGANWEEGRRWQPDAGNASPALSANAYRASLAQLELAQGPYADALAEPLASLGRHYRKRGQLGRAIAHYRRAMHIVRVNDGLHSERQIPLLRELLATFRASGDLDALDRRYEYLFRLYGMGQPPLNELRVRAALEYMRWQREAFRLKLGDRQRRLLALMKLNENLLQALQVAPGAPYAWRRDLALSQLLNYYLLRHNFEPRLQDAHLLTGGDYLGAKPLQQDLLEQRMDAQWRDAESRGASLLQALMPAARGQGAVEWARLQLALADWYFWNGSRQRAVSWYRSVFSTLSAAGETALLHTWLGEPVELPDNGAFWLPPREEVAVLEVRLDVSSRGRAGSVTLLSDAGAEDDKLGAFRRGLLATLFRPRWAQGEPQAVEGLLRSYRLSD